MSASRSAAAPLVGAAGDSNAQSDVIVDIRDLHYGVGQRQVFTGLDIKIRRGRITAIMGPSGTGKTTLLRLITGQIVPDRGTIIVDGQDLSKLSRKQLYD